MQLREMLKVRIVNPTDATYLQAATDTCNALHRRLKQLRREHLQYWTPADEFVLTSRIGRSNGLWTGRPLTWHFSHLEFDWEKYKEGIESKPFKLHMLVRGEGEPRSTPQRITLPRQLVDASYLLMTKEEQGELVLLLGCLTAYERIQKLRELQRLVQDDLHHLGLPSGAERVFVDPPASA